LAEPAAQEVALQGTTLRVYRYIYRQGKPVGIHDVQRGLGLASSSTAHYHVQKLLGSGLIKAEGDGYVVDRIIYENFVRIRRTLIPIQATFATFFAATLIVMLVIVRPPTLESGYVLGLAVNLIALSASILQTARSLRQTL